MVEDVLEELLATVPRDRLLGLVKLLSICNQYLGSKSCWSPSKLNHHYFKDLLTLSSGQLVYRRIEARPLIMAICNIKKPPFNGNQRPIIVRKSCCKCKDCINPLHLYYGFRQDVIEERLARNKTGIDPVIIKDMRAKRMENPELWSYRELSVHFHIPYATVRRICQNETYEKV